ncbi:basic proline-rich protein-like [Canis lupus familiaris]|uniref:basic proline-rich protein-like n=1 Tax=Canis lupus familiaris TaxID=9615 RepID=UPI0018F6842C|nr:basic proline-rich protein-like [Canis lupus familiaris]
MRVPARPARPGSGRPRPLRPEGAGAGCWGPLRGPGTQGHGARPLRPRAPPPECEVCLRGARGAPSPPGRGSSLQLRLCPCPVPAEPQPHLGSSGPGEPVRARGAAFSLLRAARLDPVPQACLPHVPSAAHPSRPPVTLSREATEAEESDASAAVAQDGGARPGPGRCASGLERKEAPGAHASRAAPPQPATAVGDLHAAPRPAPRSAGGARAPGAPGAAPGAPSPGTECREPPRICHGDRDATEAPPPEKPKGPDARTHPPGPPAEVTGRAARRSPSPGAGGGLRPRGAPPPHPHPHPRPRRPAVRTPSPAAPRSRESRRDLGRVATAPPRQRRARPRPQHLASWVGVRPPSPLTATTCGHMGGSASAGRVGGPGEGAQDPARRGRGGAAVAAGKLRGGVAGRRGAAREGRWRDFGGLRGRGCGGAHGGAQEPERSSARLGAVFRVDRSPPGSGAAEKPPGLAATAGRGVTELGSPPPGPPPPPPPPAPLPQVATGPREVNAGCRRRQAPTRCAGNPEACGDGEGGAPAPGPPLWDLAPLALGLPAPAHRPPPPPRPSVPLPVAS